MQNTNILDVRNLRISFRTNNGTVKAVRDISFRLKKGETLAIVGESGSGKSVTARAIMGILAGNAIVEGGEILYNGMDLMKLAEEDFHKLRGNKVSMIFQDPLSSLNPIMKIGQQLSEAMILNGRANQKSSRAEFEEKIKLLREYTTAAYTDAGNASAAAAFSARMDLFLKATEAASKREQSYNTALSYATGAQSDLEGILLELPSAQPKDMVRTIRYAVSLAEKAENPYLTPNTAALKEYISSVKAAESAYTTGDGSAMQTAVNALNAYLKDAIQSDHIDFFALGYALSVGQDEASLTSAGASSNDALRTKMKSEFSDAFLADLAMGIRYSETRAAGARQTAVATLTEERPNFSASAIKTADIHASAKKMSAAVAEAIDKIAIQKDSIMHTFSTSLDSALAVYETASKAEGEIDDLPRENIERVIDRMIDDLSKSAAPLSSDLMLQYLQRLASSMVYKVTPDMAKARAIKLMEEVGIPQPHKRYDQYPFQFSGGMRQRIVIAIALAANPDILICDEPTTALDVTIQAQILDLINGLKRERQLSVIFITHDLGVVANMADQIAVMYAGKIVEYGSVTDIFYDPRHPYTWALLSSMPDLDTKEKLEAIPGTPPNMIFPPKGDAFAARNHYALQIDFEEQPPMFEVTPTHFAATWLLHPDAPHVTPPKIVTERIERMKAYGGNGHEQ